MIDMHCHLDLYSDVGEIVDGLEANGTYVLAVTTTPKAYIGNIERFGSLKRVRIAVGLHPELVGQRFEELPDLLRLIGATKYVGEVGIDGGREHAASFQQQVTVFSEVLRRCRSLGGRLISIHSRLASDTVLECLTDVGHVGEPILHWYGGSEYEISYAAQIGCWFSVGPGMLTNRRGARVAEAIPLDRILLETDGPFGTVGNMVLKPWDSGQAISQLAEIKGVSREKIRSTILENFKILSNKIQRMSIERRRKTA